MAKIAANCSNSLRSGEKFC